MHIDAEIRYIGTTLHEPEATCKGSRPIFQSWVIRSLAINIGVPFIAIQVLLNRGVAPVTALSLVAAVPFTVAVVEIAHTPGPIRSPSSR